LQSNPSSVRNILDFDGKLIKRINTSPNNKIGLINAKYVNGDGFLIGGRANTTKNGPINVLK
jgi:hypothetical protein